MNKKQAEEIVKNLGEDERRDLLMYLAEVFDFTVRDKNGDATYFLATDGNFPTEES